MQNPDPGPECQIITDLAIDKKGRNRVLVTLDSGVTFSVGLRKSGSLERGKPLTKTEIDKLQQEDAVDRCYRDAIRYLGYRVRSCRELHRFLKSKGYAPETRDTVLDRLEACGYINDTDYARIYVDNRSRFSPRGAYVLRHELRQKGIDDRIIDRSLSDLDEEGLAFRALQKRLIHWKKDDPRTQRRKALSFLYGRGFPYEIARQALEKALPKLPLPEKEPSIPY